MTHTEAQTHNAGFGWGKVTRTVTLPGIMPRVRELFGEGFAYFAFFIALVYRAVGLLPATHAYVSPANIGRFGIQNVIGAAANNIALKRENIDQIIVFFAIIAAMLLIVLQFFYVLIALSIPTAAAVVNFDELFTTENPSQDLAFIFLDRVFGVPGIFNSCVAPAPDSGAGGGPCLATSPEMNFGDALPNQANNIPWAFHDAMHELFSFYSIALLVVAVMLFLYFIVAIVAETAQTGTPFGKRFNSVWAPIRMVVALGLLIPLGQYGLNGAQYITLYSAKLGSSVATNGWITFNETASQAMIGQDREMVASPNLPRQDIRNVISAIYFAKMCEHNQELRFNREIDAYIVNQDIGNPGTLINDNFNNARQDATAGGSIVVNIGEDKGTSGNHPAAGSSFLGGVDPLCGQITIQLPDASDTGEAAYQIQEAYFQMVQNLWIDPDIDEHAEGRAIGRATGGNATNISTLIEDKLDAIINGSGAAQAGGGASADGLKDEIDAAIEQANQDFNNDFSGATQGGTGDTGAPIPQELRERGWGAAGVWYNRIADMNGKIQVATRNVPEPTKGVALMEEVCKKRSKSDENDVSNCFDPTEDQGSKIDLGPEQNSRIAKSYAQTYDELQSQMKESSDGNYLGSIIQSIFGTEGLMNIRDNRGVHPLAQLSGVGRSLIESTIRNLGLGLSSAGMATVTRFVPGPISNLAGTGGAFFFSVASIGLTAGFVLFYIVPFLPFIYFFFAVSKWVKGIFEAMVGAPLWALAHIRIDGQGLPGDAARSGYELMLEIFLRPILIVFGLLAGLSVFAAQVIILNDIFDLVTTNLTGFSSAEVAENMQNNAPGAQSIVKNVRGPIDQLFFTVMYAIIIYLMATPSFKLVDQLPNNILRWMGSSVTPFADQADDPAGNLVQYGAVGGAQIFSSGTGAMGNISRSLGGGR